jgi:hypothetical protein
MAGEKNTHWMICKEEIDKVGWNGRGKGKGKKKKDKKVEKNWNKRIDK